MPWCAVLDIVTRAAWGFTMNTRKIRVDPSWFELQAEFQRNGVRVSHPQLSQGIVQFIRNENMVPIMVRRAQNNTKRGLFK
jgi:hypothetical protein